MVGNPTLRVTIFKYRVGWIHPPPIRIPMMQNKIKEAYDALLAKEYNKAFLLYTELAEAKEPTAF